MSATPQGHDWQAFVTEFHRCFGHPAPGSPTFDEVRADLREELMKEELKETMDGIRSGDMVEAADGLGDLIYVVVGTAVELGIDLIPVLQEIQRSNMSKLGDDGKPIQRQDGKTLKGPNFSPPDIESVLEEQGWRR